MTSGLSRNDSGQSVFFLRIDTGVILIGDVNTAGDCLILAEMN